MKKVILAMMVLGVLSVSAQAVLEYSTDFTAPPLGWQVARPGSFNGSGQYVMSDNAYIYRNIQIGDFSAVYDFSNVNMGGGLGTGNYAFQYFQINGTTGKTFLYPYLQNGGAAAESTYFIINSSAGNEYVGYLGQVTSFKLKIDWVEATGTYTLSYALNGGEMTLAKVISGFGSSTINRNEYIYQGKQGTGGVYPILAFDNYSMVPEPATMAVFGLGALLAIRRKR